jgi:hypothetical protein
MRKPSAGAGSELHNRAGQGLGRQVPRHTRVTITQVVDFQGFLSAQKLSNLSQASPFRGFAAGRARLPTKLSTSAVDA